MALALWRLDDHDLDRRLQENFAFEAGGDDLAGTLWLPDQPPLAAIILVHGDGPQDRRSSGGYAPFVNHILDAGIAVASWDKPGVGGSPGNWLKQSMADRAAETRTGLAMLKKRFQGLDIGALGFSQAGWVLPQLSADDADFLVLVGPAVSWRQQGAYYTRTRLARAGLDAAGIAREEARAKREDDLIYGPDARFDPADAPDGMSAERWAFIWRNRHLDARDYLSEMDAPLLALWGEDDLNVDAAGDAAIYRDALAGRQAETRIVVVPDATHGLLKAGPYNWQLASQWSWMAQLRFVLEGRYAFAPDALATITDWILARSAVNATQPIANTH